MNFSEIRMRMLTLSFKKMPLKLSSAKMAAILSRWRWVKGNFIGIWEQLCPWFYAHRLNMSFAVILFLGIKLHISQIQIDFCNLDKHATSQNSFLSWAYQTQTRVSSTRPGGAFQKRVWALKSKSSLKFHPKYLTHTLKYVDFSNAPRTKIMNKHRSTLSHWNDVDSKSNQSRFDRIYYPNYVSPSVYLDVRYFIRAIFQAMCTIQWLVIKPAYING